MSEEVFHLSEESQKIQNALGSEAVINQTDEGFVAKVTLLDEILSGGQGIELVIGPREPLPIDASIMKSVLNLDDEFNGLPITSLKINGVLVEGFSLYLCTEDQNGDPILGPFADSDSNVVSIPRLSTGLDLAFVFHEFGHIKSGHGIKERVVLDKGVNDQVIEKYFDSSKNTINSEGIKSDEKAMSAINEVYAQEVVANTAGLEFIRNFSVAVYPDDPDLAKISEFLRDKVGDFYLGVYGLSSEQVSSAQ